MNERLLHPAIADAQTILARELGQRAASEALASVCIDISALGPFRYSRFARERSAYAIWGQLWLILGLEKPQLFAGIAAETLETQAPTALAFLYARDRYAHSLRELVLEESERAMLDVARERLCSLIGMPHLAMIELRVWRFDKRCLPLAALGDLEGNAAWSFANVPGLEREAMIGQDTVSQLRELGDQRELCSILLHEWVHCISAVEAGGASGACLDGSLCFAAVEAATSLLEVASFCDAGPGARLECMLPLLREHPYGEQALALCSVLPERLAPALRAAYRFGVEAGRSGGDDDWAVHALNSYARKVSGRTRSAQEWKTVFGDFA